MQRRNRLADLDELRLLDDLAADEIKGGNFGLDQSSDYRLARDRKLKFPIRLKFNSMYTVFSTK
jgi:hypothetical protein